MAKLNPINYKKFLNNLNAQNYLCTRKSPPVSKYYALKKGTTYFLADTKGHYVGNMGAVPERIRENQTYYPDSKNYASLYITNLFINKKYRQKGAGSAFINIAVTESARRNCGGRVHLIAVHDDKTQLPPHIFYRKAGFDSQDWVIMDKINNFIEEGIKLPGKSLDAIPMYLPLDKVKEKLCKICPLFKQH